MRIVFMGSADFGVPSLEALADAHDVCAVVTRPDAEKGRGRRPTPTPVKMAAMERGIPVLAPASLRDEAFLTELREYGADLFFVIAFRILPPEVFTMPPKGTVNLHASLLPDYRGAAPINWAIVNGESVSGLTTFFIDENIDTGAIIMQKRMAIGGDETAGELYGRMKLQGASLTLGTVAAVETGAVMPQGQSGGDGSDLHPAPKLTKEDGRIDWSGPARDVHNLVRGMNPWPGAYTVWNGGVLKIHRTAVVADTRDAVPGTVILASPKEGVTVACGDGAVRLVEVQPPGKKPMDGASFVRGYGIDTGMSLGGKDGE